MTRDQTRRDGFYWVRFEGEVVVAEYTGKGRGCTPEGPHWHIPGSSECFRDAQVCQMLSPRLNPPKTSEVTRAMTGDEAEAAGREWHRKVTEERAPGDHGLTERSQDEL